MSYRSPIRCRIHVCGICMHGQSAHSSIHPSPDGRVGEQAGGQIAFSHLATVPQWGGCGLLNNNVCIPKGLLDYVGWTGVPNGQRSLVLQQCGILFVLLLIVFECAYVYVCMCIYIYISLSLYIYKNTYQVHIHQRCRLRMRLFALIYKYTCIPLCQLYRIRILVSKATIPVH